MSRDEYLHYLASVQLFSNCTNKQLREIGKVASQLSIPAGKTLAHEGEVGRELFIILEGTASVTREGRHLATVTAGHVVGELAVLTGQPRNATVTAETDLEILVLTHTELDQLLDDIPGLAKHLLYDVAGRLEAATPGAGR
ncbi:MAG TPA: cyclic nucleotide-binding domain-containing protein [Acidimicrobiales bacterium]|nr:cyclic nucleotide-binding domain-containing protein [Acidimicrobiales bacterium]